MKKPVLLVPLTVVAVGLSALLVQGTAAFSVPSPDNESSVARDRPAEPEQSAYVQDGEEPTAEQSAELEAFVTDEESKQEFADLASPQSSPGVAFDSAGVGILRVFQGVDSSLFAERIRTLPFEVRIESSQFSAQSFQAAESALTGMDLKDGEGFGLHYSADDDVFVVAGSLPLDRVRELSGLKDGVFTYERDEAGGRMSRGNGTSPH